MKGNAGNMRLTIPFLGLVLATLFFDAACAAPLPDTQSADSPEAAPLAADDTLSSAFGERRPAKKAFPRLGSVLIGKTPKAYSDPAYQDVIARYDLILLGKTFSLGGRTAAGIKQRNPNALVGQYTNIATVPLFRDSDYHNGLREKLFSERGPRPRGTTPDWWLREKVEMVDGELVGDADGDGIGDIVPVSQFGNGRANVTRWVKRDANGDRWPQWKISYDFDNGMDDPAFDVWYFDATNYNVRSKGFDRGVAGMDFSGGRTEDIEKINSAWRKGYRKAWKRLEELRPDMYIIGNHDWYNYADPETGALPPNNGFTKRIHGGLLEDVMRPKGGPEQKFGWGQIYDWYRFSMGYFRKPGLTYFSVTGDLTHSTAIDGTADNPTAADYQWFRYTFGTCLLQNGYYVYGAADYPSGSSLWFDEYDRAGQDDTSWMGVGIDGPGNPGAAGPVAAWQSGVYRRDFKNAVVLVNPRGNGPQSVIVDGGLRRLRGAQDPIANDGELVSELTLQDGDGIVLVRLSYSP